MKKFEFVAEVAKRSGMSQVDAEKVLNAVSEAIIDVCVEQGDEVNLPPLGKFRQRVNKPRSGTNPLTGKPLNIPESHTVAFKPSAGVKKVIEATKKTKKQGK